MKFAEKVEKGGFSIVLIKSQVNEHHHYERCPCSFQETKRTELILFVQNNWRHVALY